MKFWCSRKGSSEVLVKFGGRASKREVEKGIEWKGNLVRISGMNEIKMRKRKIER